MSLLPHFPTFTEMLPVFCMPALLSVNGTPGVGSAHQPRVAGVWYKLALRCVQAWAMLLVIGLASLVPTVAQANDEEALKAWGKRFESEILPIMRDRCMECHSGDDPDGGFDLARFSDSDRVIKKLGVWDDVGKKIRLKEMPPEGSPQLNDEQKAAFHRWLDSRPKQDLCSQLANDETQAWYRGFVMSRRLTRTEYLNAMRDVVGVPLAPQTEIPSDGSGGEGFDTNGDSLFTSALHIEQYVAATSQVIDSVVTADPHGMSAAAATARERILCAMPGGDRDESQAAREIVRKFARRAWRRPVADEEVERLASLYELSRENGTAFVESVREPLKAILLSPNFLFVVEAEAPDGGVQRLTPHQLAMRLSLFLWSSIPDDTLLELADQNQLDTPEQVTAQVSRMLKDPRAIALGENFGLQWLGLTHFLSSVRPDREVFPEYSPELAEDMRQEAIRFVANVFREDRSLLDLIDSKEIEVNGRLASHYQLELPADAAWQKVSVKDGRRGGVVTLGAALMTASYPRRTSPVLRGRWVLEEVLGARVPPPPPNVPALEEAQADRVMTLRERLELHRQNPDCAACHNRMDPLGFGLENYDGLGRWRDTDAGQAIDSSGKLPSGETFSGPAELKQLLLRRQDEFERHLVRKMLGFALGRELNKFDDCVIQDCLKRLQEDNHRAASIIETIAVSYPFQHRYFKAAIKK